LRSVTRKVSAAEAKRRFSELVNQVQYGGDRVIIQKRGRPAAALVSLNDLEALDARPGAILDCAGLFADIPEWEQIMEEVVASRGRYGTRKVQIH